MGVKVNPWRPPKRDQYRNAAEFRPETDLPTPNVIYFRFAAQKLLIGLPHMSISCIVLKDIVWDHRWRWEPDANIFYSMSELSALSGISLNTSNARATPKRSTPAR